MLAAQSSVTHEIGPHDLISGGYSPPVIPEELQQIVRGADDPPLGAHAAQAS